MTDKQRPKTQLIVAKHHQCFLNYCWKMHLGPRTRLVRYIHEVSQLRGYHDKNAEIIIVCGGPRAGEPPQVMTGSLNNKREWAQWDIHFREIVRLFDEIRLLNTAYGISVRFEECT